MLDKKILLALNGADDIFLEETTCKLGYNTETKERIVPMTNYHKRTSRRFVSILPSVRAIRRTWIKARYKALRYPTRRLIRLVKSFAGWCKAMPLCK